MIQSFIDKELGHISYIFDDREAIIIDPQRDIGEYINYINKNNLTLKYILNTHPHADFISGDEELKAIYPKAKIITYKPQILTIGDTKSHIIKTPGHTPYCVSCLVENRYIFTGDFLFVGDMGRVDLLGEENIKSLANKSYLSAKKLWGLDDGIVVFTSHIKGSLCGKNISDNYISSIGIEKKTNKTFKLVKNKQKYINNIKNQSIQKPIFFSKLSKINLNKKRLLKEIKPCENIKYIIDIRHPDKFKKAHIPKSINVYEKANIIYILGSLIEIENCIGIVGDKNSNFDDVIKRLRKIGFDNTKILGNIKNYKTIPFKRKKNKSINLEKISLSEIKKYKDYNFKCKNGYKAMAVESFLEGLE